MRKAIRLFSVFVLIGLLAGLCSVPAAAGSPEELYSLVLKEYQSALALPDRTARVYALRRCILRLQEVMREDSGKISDRCLYLVGQAHHRIHDDNQSSEDYKSAVESYTALAAKYPESPLADDAHLLLGVLFERTDPSRAYAEYSKVIESYPKGDMRQRAERMAAEVAKRIGKVQKSLPTEVVAAPSPRTAESVPPQKGPSVARLEKVQHWSCEEFTRVVLYTSAPVSYEQEAYSSDPQAKKPGTVRVALTGCSINPRLGTRLPVRDDFVQSVRVARKGPDLVQVELQSSSIETYRVFALNDPFRIVVDVRGKRTEEPSTAPVRVAQANDSPPAPSKKADEPSTVRNLQADKACSATLAKQLALEVKRIVIDPGHGGKDNGASSASGSSEKDITLMLAKELKGVLEKRLDCEVILTRTRDRFLSLEERTAFANSHKADLFVSIHTNGHEDRSLCGIETYFLNLSSDKESARVAAVENASSTKAMSDLQAILRDLMLNTKLNESARLAESVQNRVVTGLRAGNYEGIRDLGTKQAPFYVLLGAEMPSILIETGFISNEREELRLKDKRFQEDITNGIAAGIEAYIRQMRGFAKAGDRQ
ncbi:MAG: N-acetylmuramoyl-L-alanine amidase [Acidobacteriota bacterium]